MPQTEAGRVKAKESTTEKFRKKYASRDRFIVRNLMRLKPAHVADICGMTHAALNAWIKSANDSGYYEELKRDILNSE